MQAPAIESGKLKVYFENLDNITVNTLNPKCYLCGNILTTADKVAVVIKASHVLRFSKPCWEVFAKGVVMFIALEGDMRIFTNEIQ